MRAINASLSLAAEIGSRVEIVWYRDRSLNCRFDEMFEIPEGVSGIYDVNLHSPLGDWSKKLVIARRSRLGRNFFDQSYIAAAMLSGIDLRREFSGKDVFIETCSAYYPAADFGKFVPVADLARKIRDYSGLVSTAVGVHLRRTDNAKSLRYSPVDLFVEKMDELLAAGRCDNFFVATDSPTDEQYFRDIFRERIVTHPKASYDRNDRAAIKDALVDLYCLAQCRMIIGSYWSSFSETAAKIGSRELFIINTDE